MSFQAKSSTALRAPKTRAAR